MAGRGLLGSGSVGRVRRGGGRVEDLGEQGEVTPGGGDDLIPRAEPEASAKGGKGTGWRWDPGEAGPALRGRVSRPRGEVCRPRLQLGPLRNCPNPLTHCHPGCRGTLGTAGVEGCAKKQGHALRGCSWADWGLVREGDDRATVRVRGGAEEMEELGAQFWGQGGAFWVPLGVEMRESSLGSWEV